MAAHAALQPSSVFVSGGANRTYLSNLSLLDRNFTPKLIEIYGSEMYTMLLDAVGKKVKVENRDFYHSEKRRNMVALQVASTAPVTPTAGVTVTVTLAAASHTDSGTKSPIREGMVVQISGTGVLGRVFSKNTSVANAHTFVVHPLDTAQAFAPATNDWLLDQGNQHVGEASDYQDSTQPLFNKITNTTTEIRYDYRITDRASMERLEIEMDGNRYYRYIGSKEAEKMFLNHREKLLMNSRTVNNSNITTNGTVGTKGLIQQVTSGGSTLSYTANAIDIPKFQEVGRELTYNGAASEIHALQDIYQFDEVQRKLFAEYGNGAILWDSVGGSRDAAARYGFSSLAIGGFTYHFKKYSGFTPEQEYGIQPATAPAYRHYGLFIPQGYSNVVGNGNLPTIALRYQECPSGGEVNAYVSGGAAEDNKTGKQEIIHTAVGYYGVQVAAANQCVILDAA